MILWDSKKIFCWGEMYMYVYIIVFFFLLCILLRIFSIARSWLLPLLSWFEFIYVYDLLLWCQISFYHFFYFQHRPSEVRGLSGYRYTVLNFFLLIIFAFYYKISPCSKQINKQTNWNRTVQAANTGRCITCLNNCDSRRPYQRLFVCTIPNCIKKAIAAVLDLGVARFITWHCSRCYGLITDSTSFTPHLSLPLKKIKCIITLPVICLKKKWEKITNLFFFHNIKCCAFWKRTHI